ncbi:MAG: site-specific DNA-methyltransferase [Oscillospiraceae bacterium]|jgi:adenine-specific DNA-methyltransferase
MIKEILNRNETLQPSDREIDILQEHFPACFKNDGSFDIERFKEFLSNKVTVTHEGYELKFLGKNYARLLASLDTTTVIVPDEEHNGKPENAKSENVYISGDNLDGLKHLLKSYSRKVKCIYIDPPYNTGSDGFVYNDNFDFTVEGLSEKLSIDENQARHILDLTKRGSASHSAWLMSLYPRLLLSRDLLEKEGVIFISIDDNEQSNMKLLCDDVFGEENFISQLVWEKKKKGSYLANDITNIKEYVLVYAKNKSAFGGLVGQINSKEETYPCVNANNGRDVRIIPAGIKSKYHEKNFEMKSGEIISDKTMNLRLLSDLVIKNGALAQNLKIEGNWRYSQDAMTEYARDGELYITQDLYLRRIVREPRNKGLKDLLLRVGEDENKGYSYEFDYNNLQSGGWGSNEDADEEQRLLFGEQSLMSYPKPVLLIMKLLASTQQDEMIVCDFYSGSATTAEAILRSNVAGKQYKYILIQLPENLDAKIDCSTGDDKLKAEKVVRFLDSVSRPHTLDQIGIERIIRASKAIKEANPDTTTDLGFKHYTLVEPSQNTIDKLEKFDPDINTFDTMSTILSDFGKPTVLATWLERDGYGLTSAPEEVDFAGYKGYYIGKHLYLIDEKLSDAAIEAIVVKFEMDGSFNPENVILFGYSFTWTEREALQTNIKRLKDTENNLHINFDVRY